MDRNKMDDKIKNIMSLIVTGATETTLFYEIKTLDIMGAKSLMFKMKRSIYLDKKFDDAVYKSEIEIKHMLLLERVARNDTGNLIMKFIRMEIRDFIYHTLNSKHCSDMIHLITTFDNELIELIQTKQKIIRRSHLALAIYNMVRAEEFKLERKEYWRNLYNIIYTVITPGIRLCGTFLYYIREN